jgi:hypothetical protein
MHTFPTAYPGFSLCYGWNFGLDDGSVFAPFGGWRRLNSEYPKQFGIETPRSASGSSSEEVSLNWNKRVRQTHRWVCIAFTLAVIINIVAVAQKKYTASVGLLAVIPLALLFLSGLYLFVLPYATKWLTGQSTD